MSQKNKMRKAKKEEMQEKQGKDVVIWIFIALILLAVIYAILAYNAL